MSKVKAINISCKVSSLVIANCTQVDFTSTSVTSNERAKEDAGNIKTFDRVDWEVSFSGYVETVASKASASALKVSMLRGELVPVVLTSSSTAIASGTGRITKLTFDAPKDGSVKLSATVKGTSKITQ